MNNSVLLLDPSPAGCTRGPTSEAGAQQRPLTPVLYKNWDYLGSLSFRSCRKAAMRLSERIMWFWGQGSTPDFLLLLQCWKNGEKYLKQFWHIEMEEICCSNIPNVGALTWFSLLMDDSYVDACVGCLCAGVGLHTRTTDPTTAALSVSVHHLPRLPGPAAALQHGRRQAGLHDYTHAHTHAHTLYHWCVSYRRNSCIVDKLI